MYPHDLHIAGFAVSVWNAVFLLAVVAGWFVFRRSSGAEPRLRMPLLRYTVFAYLSALAAQLFAYAFDLNTSLTPPPGVSLAAWYLNPLAGPKTLYGVIVLAPLSVVVATLGARLSLARGLDLWTPAMLIVVAIVRAGCLLQGCCYGMRSDALGVSFAAGSPVYWKQLGEGLIAQGERSLPVVPTQALESLFLFGLFAWSLRREGTMSQGRLFGYAVAAYSIFRFFVELVRADAERGIYAGLATSQWIALAVLTCSTVAVLWPSLRNGRVTRVAIG